jgi:hypothetical protein
LCDPIIHFRNFPAECNLSFRWFAKESIDAEKPVMMDPVARARFADFLGQFVVEARLWGTDNATAEEPEIWLVATGRPAFASSFPRRDWLTHDSAVLLPTITFVKVFGPTKPPQQIGGLFFSQCRSGRFLSNDLRNKNGLVTAGQVERV